MTRYIEYLDQLVGQGGPSPEYYVEANQWANEVFEDFDAGAISLEQLAQLRSAFLPLHTEDTMHGMAYQKPHGYAGDFEIIDRHYRQHVCEDDRFQRWDRLWHWGAAATAVRNRPAYLKDTILRCAKRKGSDELLMLDLGSGPARDVALVLDDLPNLQLTVHCVELDPKAIAYARSVCSHLDGRVRFIEANALRFRPHTVYDVVWAGGLFDYFTDRIFQAMLRRFTQCLDPCGVLVVGNFADENPNAGWMRFCDWNIRHRSSQELLDLAVESGISLSRASVGREPAGVNIFLHIRGEE